MREMKDSGIEWVGKVPATWKIMPNKYIMTKKKVIKEVYDGENIISLSMNGVIIRDLEAGGKMPKTFDGYQIVYPGNLLMCLFDYDVTPRCIGLIKDYGVTSPAYSQFVMNNGNYSGYYYYYYLMIDHTKALLHLAKNLRHSLTEEQLGAILAPVPTIEEQQRIVDFLDFKCSKIDASAEDIQKEISLLEEYKKSVITEAVTKGLNPDVEMKDSGIEWIGEIPKDWEFPKITHILDYTHPYPIGDGDHGTIKAENYSEEGIPFIRVQNLGFATELIMNNVVYITEKQNNGIINSTLYPNDILFAKTGATIGKVGIMPENIKKANTTSHVGKITVSEEVVPKYIFYVLSSFIGYKQFWDIALMKSTRPELSIDEIKTLHVLLPKTKEEQQQIVDYLDTKCSEIDSLIADKKRQLDILADYKKSLIYEYVTGKKEVPVNE